MAPFQPSTNLRLGVLPAVVVKVSIPCASEEPPRINQIPDNLLDGGRFEQA
jgi:hypothetical protein